MKKIRIGVVGLGHRGRAMFKLAGKFDYVVCAAACDKQPRNWYETQWREDLPFCERFPEAGFYEDYEQMLAEANLDAVIVETGADIHADFCIKALERNVNVLTDIPVVASLAEADRLWQEWYYGDEEIRSDIFVIEQLSLHIDHRTLPALGENTWLVYDGRGDEYILIHADGIWAARSLRDIIW